MLKALDNFTLYAFSSMHRDPMFVSKSFPAEHRHSPGVSERSVSGEAHAGVLLHHVTDEIFCFGSKGDTHTLWRGLQRGRKCALRICELTRIRYVIPEGRVKLVLRLHDLGEQSCLTFFIERRISTESETKAFIKKGSCD